MCEVATNEGGRMELVFDRGVPHGPVRRFGPDGELQWTGRYRDGVPRADGVVSVCWRSNDGGDGWLAGGCNRSGRMQGDAVVYLYPNLHMALVGRWQNDCMRSARLGRVVGMEEREGMPFPVVEAEEDAQQFCLDVSGYTVISRFPMLRDPYEDALVECRQSNVPGSGEGLFAKADIPKGTVVAFYNGIRSHDCHVSMIAFLIFLIVKYRRSTAGFPSVLFLSFFFLSYVR